MVHCTSPFPYLFIFIGISISGMTMSIIWGQHADGSGNIVCMTPQYSHIYLVDIVASSSSMAANSWDMLIARDWGRYRSRRLDNREA
jgi:hypothetical protein